MGPFASKQITFKKKVGLQMNTYRRTFVRYCSVAALSCAALLCASCTTTGGNSAGDMDLKAGIAQIAGEIEQALPEGTRIAITNFDSPSARFSAYIMEELEAVLIQHRKFMVVSHRQTETIRNEVDFQLSGEVSDETAVLIGHAIGAEVIITGALTDLGGKYQFRFGAINIESQVWQASTAATVRQDSTIAHLLPTNNAPPPDVVPAKPDPALATRYFNAGFAHYEAKEYRDAIADFNRVLQITSNDIDTLFYRSYLYAEIKDYDGAIAGYTELIELKPDNAVYYYNRGIAYYGKGDYDRAIAGYTQALWLNPDYATAYHNRGAAYQNKGDHDRAIADYTQAIRINPNYAAAYNNRGNAYQNKGDHDHAIADLNQAIRINPNYAAAYFNRGNAYYYKKDYPHARADWEQALRQNPNITQARENLELLRAMGY
jgi:tetratricopeptide (TPR) repeat protein